MKPAHAHVVEPFHPIAEELGGTRRLLRHGDVGSPGRAYADEPAQALAGLLNPDDARNGIVSRIGETLPDKRRLRGRGAGPQHLPIALHQPLEDAQQMVVRLALAEHDLGGTRAQPAMAVKFGEAEVVEGFPAEMLLRLEHGHLSGPYLFQDFSSLHSRKQSVQS